MTMAKPLLLAHGTVLAAALVLVSCGSSSKPRPVVPDAAPTGGASGDTGGGPGGIPGGGGSTGTGGSVVPPGGDGGAPGTGGAPGMNPDSGSTMPPVDGGLPMPPPSTEVPLPPCKRTVNVANSGELGSALGAAQAGDCIVMADGSYTFPTVGAKGTAAAPIVVKAANTLKAVVSSGDLTLEGAAYVVIQGIMWNGMGVIKVSNCDHCRISRFRLQRNEPAAEIDWVTMSGTSKYTRIDHNDFGPQDHLSNMIMVAGQGNQICQYTQIDHNFFHDVHYSGGNGWEIIRNGLSGWTFSSAHSLIERNLFKATASDPEVISVKSSDNVVRYNTMRASAGQFVFRHGNGNEMYGNYILGDGVMGAGGIRIHGGKHKIYNNYVEGTPGTYGINLEGGDCDETGPLTGHHQIFDTILAFNTVVNDSHGGIIIGGSHPLAPLRTTIAYNLVVSSGAPLITNMGDATDKFIGNIVSGPMLGNTLPADAVKMMDPKLMKMGEVFRPAAGSPIIDLGDAAMFPFMTDDIDGRPRSKADVGAMEVTDVAAKYGLVTEADVGPMAP
jgi:poly(beta-D-mannuronate) lyase